MQIWRTFFKYENPREPPSLAYQRTLRPGTKADILSCVGAPTTQTPAAIFPTVIVFDMAASVIVHMIRPYCAKTFLEVIGLCLIPS